MKALAAIVLLAAAALATSACSLIWQPDSIKPNDMVKTPEQAITLAIHDCGSVVPDTDPDHWDAHLEADIWHVYWSHRMSSASALIEKGDGTFDNCEVNVVAE